MKLLSFSTLSVVDHDCFYYWWRLTISLEIELELECELPIIYLSSWLEERVESRAIVDKSFFSKKEIDVVSLALADGIFSFFSFSFSFTNYRIHSLVRKYVSTGDGKTSQTYFIFSVVGNSRTNEYRQNEVKANHNVSITNQAQSRKNKSQ